jgi:hypothetical protein
MNGLCRAGGVAALILIVYSLATMIQIVLLGGQPHSAAEAFSLLQDHKAIGLLRLDLPTMLILPVYYLLFLGLFAALHLDQHSDALLATCLGFAGVTLVLATPTPLSMLTLSDKYAAATTDAARNQLLSAGEAILAGDMWHATGSTIGGILTQCGAVLICIVMLRGNIFGKPTGYMGIVIHGFDLAHILIGIPLPAVGVFFMALAGPLYPVWFFLVGRRLLQIASGASVHPPPEVL